MKQINMKTLTTLLAIQFCVILHAGDGKGAGNKSIPAGSRPVAAPIKPTVPDKPMVSSFPGGIILSRVQLKSSDDLSPYADKQSGDYSERSQSLAGLLVFHTGGGDSSLPKGLYVWDGDKWQKVSYEL
ncbi:hypothetical protein [Dysgonomonas termitidis]|uniref:Uncharacterized protein n=1 Tax=Dysgonomonas termitidis TaxID=1516126 RepID=A0ABV9L2B3_9BACT